MIDQHSVERAAERFRAPEGSFERLTLRRNKKRRDRRIRAGAVGLAIAIALGWAGVDAFRSAPPGPLDDPTPGPSEDLGIFEPVAGRIVYGDRDGIWGLDPAGPADRAAAVQLTPETGTPLGWSSDGTRLLVSRGDLDEQRLFVLHADGSETQVTDPPMVMRNGATISPDGSLVVFHGGPATPRGSCCDLYAVDADGGPAELLLEVPGVVQEPTFSPDGTRIAYVIGSGDHSHSVWVMKADGTDAHQILANETTQGAGHVYGLAWSPAGDLIAIGIEGATYTFATDGSGFTEVIAGGDRPYWSPDGSQLAYTGACLEDFDGCGLGIADADGSNVREFRFAAAGPWHPGHVAQTETSTPTAARRGAEFIVLEPLGTGLRWDLAAPSGSSALSLGVGTAGPRRA